jgi:hypothetical protein
MILVVRSGFISGIYSSKPLLVYPNIPVLPLAMDWIWLRKRLRLAYELEDPYSWLWVTAE